MDHRDRWLGKVDDGGVRLSRNPVVFQYALAGRTFLGEFRNVRAGNERLAARAAHDHHPDLIVILEFGHDFRDRLPHIDRHGVVPCWIVELHPADRSILFGDHPLGTGFHEILLHAFLLAIATIETWRISNDLSSAKLGDCLLVIAVFFQYLVGVLALFRRRMCNMARRAAGLDGPGYGPRIPKAW